MNHLYKTHFGFNLVNDQVVFHFCVTTSRGGFDCQIESVYRHGAKVFGCTATVFSWLPIDIKHHNVGGEFQEKPVYIVDSEINQEFIDTIAKTVNLDAQECFNLMFEKLEECLDYALESSDERV